jgi:hypothetical protein
VVKHAETPPPNVAVVAPFKFLQNARRCKAGDEAPNSNDPIGWNGRIGCLGKFIGCCLLGFGSEPGALHRLADGRGNVSKNFSPTFTVFTLMHSPAEVSSA